MKKKNIKLVILAEAVLFAVVFMVYVLMCGEEPGMLFIRFLDYPSLIGILIVTICGLIIMGEGKEFMKAFSVGSKKYSLMELKNISEAVGACQKLVLYGGLLELVIGLVTMCSHVSDAAFILPNISVLALAGFYTVFFEYLLLPLKINAVKCMNEEMDVDYEE